MEVFCGLLITIALEGHAEVNAEARGEDDAHEREKVGLEDARRGEDAAQASEEQEGHAGADRERLHPAVGHKRLQVFVDALQVFGDALQFLEEFFQAIVDAREATVDALEAIVERLKALVVEDAKRGVLRARSGTLSVQSWAGVRRAPVRAQGSAGPNVRRAAQRTELEQLGPWAQCGVRNGADAPVTVFSSLERPWAQCSARSGADAPVSSHRSNEALEVESPPQIGPTSSSS